MTANHSYDVIVIGAGIAGASVAAHLATNNRVLLLEMERQPGYHTTGRSAALFTETYGPPAIQALTRASAAFFDHPPAGFADNPLLSARGVMLIARPDQTNALNALIAQSEQFSAVQKLSADEAISRVPILRQDYVNGAMFEPGARDIDVNGLHQGYLKLFRARGGLLQGAAAVSGLQYTMDRWEVSGRGWQYSAPRIVNAAGAWADEVGALAGCAPIGLVPKRRTALIIAPPPAVADPSLTLSAWPAVIDVGEQFYLKPDAGRLLISPADETPSAPCDAQPEEMDVAVCVDRIQTAFDIDVRRIENRWAGLRSFVADKCPVCGYDNTRPGFFWLAGQGGYGIQSAPALSRVAAAMAEEQALPQDIVDQGLNPDELAVDRLGTQSRMSG